MDQNNIVILANRDSELLLNTFALIEILKDNISRLEYTGDFHSINSLRCDCELNLIRNTIMKKLIETE